MAEKRKENPTKTETVKADKLNENSDGIVKDEMTQEEYVAFLEGELGKNIALADESKASAQRLRADFDNYKKRNAQISTESRQLGIETVLEDLLPILDTAERAKSMITDKSALEGFSMMQQHIIDVFEKFDVKEIEAEGKDFDAKYMSAALREEKPEMAGKVIEVLTKGYMIGDKVLRYAFVKVGC
ncbi:MAG TPA: nucleotide exchange factor GrpE [Clostridia bacterium]|nr:nucleotide exchange factor GrpE [Clostridia bacterium]